jgi:hypothetical protein
MDILRRSILGICLCVCVCVLLVVVLAGRSMTIWSGSWEMESNGRVEHVLCRELLPCRSGGPSDEESGKSNK